MKVRDVMTAHPVLATARDADRDRVRQLMEDADIHHVPVVNGDELVGVWPGRGRLGVPARWRPRDRAFRRGRGRSGDVRADARRRGRSWCATRACRAAILDPRRRLAILRTALGRGSEAAPQPTVHPRRRRARHRKTTLIVAPWPSCRLDAVAAAGQRRHRSSVGGRGRRVVNGSAHWGPARPRRRAAAGRAADPGRGPGRGPGPVARHRRGRSRWWSSTRSTWAACPPAHLRDAQAIVLTHAEEATSDEAEAAAAACGERFPGVRVFVVGQGAGDDGLAEWARSGPRLRDAPARLAPLLRAASRRRAARRGGAPPAGGAAAPAWHTGLPIAPDRVGLGAPAAALARAGTRSGRGRSAPTTERAVRVEVRARHGVWHRGGASSSPGRSRRSRAAWRRRWPGWVGGRRVAGRGRARARRRARRPAWCMARRSRAVGSAAAGPAGIRVATGRRGRRRLGRGGVGGARGAGVGRPAPPARARGGSGARRRALMLDPGAGMPSLGLAPDGGAAVAWGPQPETGAVRAALRPAGDGWGPAVVLDGTAAPRPRRPAPAGRSGWRGAPAAATRSSASPRPTSAPGPSAPPKTWRRGPAPRSEHLRGGGLAVAWTPPAGGLAALVRGPAAPGAPAGLAAPGAPADGRPRWSRPAAPDARR